MKTIIHNIAEFFENISSKSKGTEIAESSHAEIDRYVSGKVDYYAEEASTVSEAIKEEIGIESVSLLSDPDSIKGGQTMIILKPRMKKSRI